MKGNLRDIMTGLAAPCLHHYRVHIHVFGSKSAFSEEEVVTRQDER